MNLSALLARFTVERTQPGGWLGYCPAHDDTHTPSFSVRKMESGGLWLHCFAGCSYDSILSALEVSRDDLRGVVDDEPEVKPTASAASELEPGQIAGLQRTADVTTPALLEDADALAYVARRWGATPEDAQRLGLGLTDQDGGRILAIIRNADGQAVGIQGRAIADGVSPKWDTPAGSGYWRAGFLGSPSGSGPVLVTEGPGDGITAAVAGYDVVPVFGATSGRSLAKLADALAGREVYVVGDNDDAGRRFAAVVREVIPHAVAVSVPERVNDLSEWRSEDPDAFPGALAAAIAEAGTAKPADDEPTAKGKGKRADDGSMTPEAVMRFIAERYDLLKSEDGIAYAVPRAKDAPKVAREVASLRAEVSAAIWRERKRVPGTSTVPAALATAEGLASDLPVTPLALRAAVIRETGGDVVQIDLGDESGAFVEVTAHGWSVHPASHTGRRATFRRTSATHALPVPARGGSRDQLRALLGLAVDDAAWPLLWGWLVSAWFADVPRPILWTTGPQGSGKSTRSKFVLDLVDPAASLSSEPGKNQRDDTVAALGRYVPSWDNVAKISDATSDWFCRLVTGANDDGRELYTNDGLRVRNLMRAGMATSITLPYGLKNDALERLLRVEFERMPAESRRTTSALSAEYERARPLVFGAMLDDLVGVLAHLGEVKADEARTEGRRYELARMADYTQVLHALDIHAGHATGDGYAAAYLASVQTSMTDRAEDDPVLVAVRDVVASGGGHWQGRPGRLLEIVRHRLSSDDMEHAAMPRSGRGMGDMLTKQGEALRAIGVLRVPSTNRRDVALAMSEDVELPERPANVTTLKTPERKPSADVGGADLDDVLA